jgi:nucleoside-diphosphate-sugar epimerase
MGISPTDTQTLIENVDLVINCAASVDFNTRLDDAARINIFGTLRAHDLFSRMVRGKTFLHVSTAYVNADIPGFLEERIYPKGFDPEALFAELQAMKEVNQFISLFFSLPLRLRKS